MTASSANRYNASERLGPGEAHLWLCTLERASSLEDAVLSGDERNRYREAVLGRVWLRHLLSSYADVAPGGWQFECGRHGKPRQKNGVPLEFNLSHSGDWLAAVVTADVPVGVDIQQQDRHRNMQRLARRYYAAAEVEYLAGLDAEAGCRHFYRLWTLKEAWTKAHGAALPGALGEVGYRIEGQLLVCEAPGAMTGSSQWLAELGNYSLALCGLRRGLRLLGREWLEGGAAGAVELHPVASSGMA